MSLKAKIRNLAKEKNIPAQVILQSFMFERLLVRLAASSYQDKFVLKGGMLVASIVGLDNRATMDLDTTLKNLPLTPEAIRDALEKICAVPVDDGLTFEIGTISPIREDDIYGGYRVALTGRFETILTPMTIDVSTGDVITPHAVRHQFSEIFNEEKTYGLWAYNIETILAEKVETILRRGVFNTRPRDFYDVYILATTQSYDRDLFHKALQETAAHRGTTEQIADTAGILQTVSDSPELQALWEKYRKQFAYAENIRYNEIMNLLSGMIDWRCNRKRP
jgi:predicted nucleotidyltransferase component of viral defense system